LYTKPKWFVRKGVFFLLFEGVGCHPFVENGFKPLMCPDHVCSNPFFVGATPSSRKASQTTTNHPDHRAPSHLASLAAVPETKNSLQTSQGRVNKGFDLESQLGRHKDGPCHFLIKSDVLPGDWLAFVKTGSRKTVATVWPEASCPLGPSLPRHLPKKADSLIFVTSRSPVDKVGGQLR
jgi:hypothetical protein